LIRW